MKVAVLMWFGVLGLCAALPPAGATPEEPTPVPTKSPREQLASFAKGKRLGGSAGGSSGTVVITDEVVDRYGFPESESPESTTGATALPPASPTNGLSARDLWRERIREQYARIEACREQVRVTDVECSALWTAFYACDDPSIREHELRPDLIRSIHAAERAQDHLATAGTELADLIAQARKAGAQPGWFRGLEPSRSITVIGQPE